MSATFFFAGALTGVLLGIACGCVLRRLTRPDDRTRQHFVPTSVPEVADRWKRAG
jgi:hypothetical protein